MRIACPPILCDCKYLNFTRASSANETIGRQAIAKLEGTDTITDEHIALYSDHTTPQYHEMVEFIRKKLNFTTLEYHHLDNMLTSVGVDKCKLCTYCWNGKE